MFGALHIEKILLVLHGDIIRGSGLLEILQANELSVIGVDAIVNVNDIKKARYCLHVTLCAVFQKLREAHEESESMLLPLDWLSKVRKSESEMCLYWYLTLKIEISILIFIRSLREGNFGLFKQIVWSLLKWSFQTNCLVFIEVVFSNKLFGLY